MNHKAVCRTAPATLGLSKSCWPISLQLEYWKSVILSKSKLLVRTYLFLHPHVFILLRYYSDFFLFFSSLFFFSFLVKEKTQHWNLSLRIPQQIDMEPCIVSMYFISTLTNDKMNISWVISVQSVQPFWPLFVIFFSLLDSTFKRGKLSQPTFSSLFMKSVCAPGTFRNFYGKRFCENSHVGPTPAKRQKLFQFLWCRMVWQGHGLGDSCEKHYTLQNNKAVFPHLTVHTLYSKIHAPLSTLHTSHSTH